MPAHGRSKLAHAKGRSGSTTDPEGNEFEGLLSALISIHAALGSAVFKNLGRLTVPYCTALMRRGRLFCQVTVTVQTNAISSACLHA